MTEFRNLDGVKGNGKLDAWRVDWHILRADPDNDLRDLTTPANRKHIEDIKASIEAAGVKAPLEYRRDDADDTVIYITDGRVRLVALAELEAEKRQVPETVLVLPEARGTDPVQRTVNMMVLSTLRKNYDPFEMGRGVKRLQDFGLSDQKIAERMQWKDTATVHRYLDSLTLKPKLRDMVDKDQISLTEAIRLQKKAPDIDPAELRKAAEDEARRLNKNKGKPIEPKVRPRHVREVMQRKAEPKAPAAALPASQQPAARVELPPAPAMISPVTEQAPLSPDANSSLPSVRTMTDAELEDGLKKAGYLQSPPDQSLLEKTREQVAEQNEWHPDDPLKLPSHLATERQAAQIREKNALERQGVNDLIAALEPFANLAHEHDFNARGDDEVIEVPIKHLKQAWIVFARVCGERDAA